MVADKRAAGDISFLDSTLPSIMAPTATHHQIRMLEPDADYSGAQSRFHLPRPRRSGAARRQQALRAETRRIQRFLKGIQELSSHRGCQPSRLGAALASLLKCEVPN